MLTPFFRSPQGLSVSRAAGLLLALAVFFVTLPAAADVPAAPDRAKLIGQPTGLIVQPATVTLTGPRAMQQLIVSGKYADGSVRDLTPFITAKVEGPDVFTAEENLFLKARRNGAATLVLQAGGQTARVPVTVRDVDKPQPVSFRNELIAVLNVGGCNQGACHGTPSGKNGFKLSLRGYDPPADYIELTRDVLGRRTGRQDPGASLMYLKPLGRLPHEGGQRFRPDSVPAQTMHAWLSEGLQDDPSNLPKLQKIDVLPGSRVLNEPARWQQLSVQGHFSGGEVRDLTRLTVFTSSDPAIASVNANGLVEFYQSGEVAILSRCLEEMVAVRLTYLEPKAGFAWSNPREHNFIDKHAFAKLKMLNIQPSDLCTDQEFVRRAYMDVCGILPTGGEVKKFLGSKEPNRRAKLIDALLERPEYADLWTLKWADVLRSSRKTIQVKGTHNFQKWLRNHIDKNTPLDEVVREIITANGNTFANPAANFYRISRDPTSLGETAAQLFFGIRMQCAKCHNHPFERWTQDDYYGLAAFFARVKQKKDPYEPSLDPKAPGAEFIFVERAGEVIQPRTSQAMPPRFLGGKVPQIPPGKDRRDVLAQWVTAPDNTFFSKSVVNRIWYHVMGRGIVDPVDDFRDSNPSANDDLLDTLARDFVDKKYDVKHLLRTILNSRTYQLSAQTNDFNKDDNKYFSHAVVKMHTAETLFDALCFVTDVPEKFAGLPLGTRAVQLPDGEINHPFLKTFGQPARELTCECEREGDSNLAQALQLINGPTVNDRLRNPNNRIGKLLANKMPERDILNELFLVSLSRPPTADEAKDLLDHVAQAQDKRKAWEDVLWALINAKEFLFRH